MFIPERFTNPDAPEVLLNASVVYCLDLEALVPESSILVGYILELANDAAVLPSLVVAHETAGVILKTSGLLSVIVLTEP